MPESWLVRSHQKKQKQKHTEHSILIQKMMKQRQNEVLDPQTDTETQSLLLILDRSLDLRQSLDNHTVI